MDGIVMARERERKEKEKQDKERGFACDFTFLSHSFVIYKTTGPGAE